MKNLYVCEKCGKMFEEYDQAWECERSHATVEPIFGWELPQNSNIQCEFYSEGEALPEYVVLKANMMDANGDWDTATMPNGRKVMRYRAAVYKRVDKVKLPNGMTPDEYTAAVLKRQVDDNPEEDETEEDEG